MISDFGIQNAPVRRDKASSSPKRPGEIYQGVVTKVYPDGRVILNVQALGTSYGPLMPLGVTQSSKMIVGDTALCAFSNQSMTSMVVFGNSRPINQSMILIMDSIASFPDVVDALPEGCLAYAKDTNSYFSWDGSSWVALVSTGPTGPQGPPGTNGDWSTAQEVVNVSTVVDAMNVLQPSSAGKLIFNSGVKSIYITESTAFSIGQRVDIARLDAGSFSVVQAGSAVVRCTPTNTLRAQYSVASLICIATDTYLLSGDLG